MYSTVSLNMSTLRRCDCSFKKYTPTSPLNAKNSKRMFVSSFFPAKVRRLYDIANILQSLKLIEKVHIRGVTGKKPGFKWIGKDIESLSDSTSKWKGFLGGGGGSAWYFFTDIYFHQLHEIC